MGITRAIIIGISKYCDPGDHLPLARTSAQLLERTLADYYAFDHIQGLYDEAASLNGILAGLDSLMSLRREDSALVAFSGHAKSMDEQWYFVPQNASLREGNHRKLLPASELCSEYMKRIRASHVLLILDACYGGLVVQARKGATQDGEIVDDALVAELMSADRPSRYAISAGEASERVMDGGGGGVSVFMAEMCDYLSTFERRVLPATALALEVKLRVLRRLQYSVPRQHPCADHLDQDKGGIFCFVKKECKAEVQSAPQRDLQPVQGDQPDQADLAPHAGRDRTDQSKAKNRRRIRRVVLYGTLVGCLVAVVRQWDITDGDRTTQTGQVVEASLEGTNDLRPFPEGVFGVIVGPFRGDPAGESQESLQENLSRIVKGRAVGMGLDWVRVELGNAADVRWYEKEEGLSEILTNMSAKVVLCGEIVGNRIIGYAAVPNDLYCLLTNLGWSGHRPGHIVRFIESSEIGDRHMKALTDLPTLALSMAAVSKAREEGALQKAIDYLETVKANFPSNPWVHVEMGEVFHEMNESSKAMDCFNRAVTVAPHESIGYVARGTLYVTKGELARGLADYKAVEAIDPGLVGFARASAYAFGGKHKKAIEELTDLIDKESELRSMWYLQRAFLHAQRGHKEKALDDIRLASASPNLYPQNQQTHFFILRSMVYEVMGDDLKALDDLEAAIAISPDELAMYQRRADIFTRRKEVQNAAADIRHMLELGGKEPRILFLAGAMYRRLQMWSEAMDAYERFLKVAPPWQADYVRIAREHLSEIQKAGVRTGRTMVNADPVVHGSKDKASAQLPDDARDQSR